MVYQRTYLVLTMVPRNSSFVLKPHPTPLCLWYRFVFSSFVPGWVLF